MYSRITASKNGRDAIRYAAGKRSEQNRRNVLVTTINMIPNGKYAEQMALLWKKARANHKVQVRRIIISFSKKELEPESEADVELANTIVKEFITTYYPDRQAALFFQRDGTGGCLHCHAIVNDISLSDHKGCTRAQQFYKYVRHGIDTVAAKYIALDDGGRLKSKQTHTERAKADKAAKIIAQNPILKEDELRNALINEKAYSYKEDMKNRIKDAALMTTNEKDFLRYLKTLGVCVKKKNSAKYGEHYVYDFVACSVGVKNTKARSYKLGYSYGPEALRFMWTQAERFKQADLKKDADEFTEWMNRQGKRCFFFDANGNLIRADFDLRDELYEEYLLEKSKSKEKATALENSAPAYFSTYENTATETKAKANRTAHHRQPSTDVIKTDIEDVRKLLKDTDDIIRRLSAIQKTQTLNNKPEQEVIPELSLGCKKQNEKTL